MIIYISIIHTHAHVRDVFIQSISYIVLDVFSLNPIQRLINIYVRRQEVINQSYIIIITTNNENHIW